MRKGIAYYRSHHCVRDDKREKNNNMNSFLQEVATDLISRFGSDLKDVAIVFNNKRPVTFLKKHLGELLGKAFWSPSFFTIQEFFSKSTNLLPADWRMTNDQFLIPNFSFPALCLIVSGGHTELVLVRRPGAYEVIG